jgi:hypothetical protein
VESMRKVDSRPICVEFWRYPLHICPDICTN